MKILITIFVLLLSTSVLADDISDFQIEGISIGDSLLDYLNETYIKSEIEDSKRVHPSKNKNFSEIYWFKETDNYNYLSFIIKSDDKKYIIKGVFGKKHIGLKECLALKKNIAEEFESMFPNTKRKNSKFSPDFSTDLDPSKKTIIYYSYFDFYTKDKIVVECYDYSKFLEDKGSKDGLLISLRLRNAGLWLQE